MSGLQKYYLIGIIVGLSSYSTFGQNSIRPKVPCNNSILVTQIDSIEAFKTDQELVASIEFLSNYSELLKINHLDHCEVYFKVLLLEAKGYCLAYKFDKALSLFHELILKSKSTSFYEIQAVAYIELELVYEFLENWEQCHRSIEKADLLIKEHNLESVKPLYFVRLSCLTKFTGSKEDAIRYAHECIKHSILQNDRETERGAYMMLAGLSEDKQMNIKYHRKAANIYADFEDLIGQSYMYLSMAGAATIKTEEGKSYLDTVSTLIAKTTIRDNNYFNVLRSYYGLIRNDFEQKNQIDSAYHYAKLAFEAERKAAISRDRKEVELDVMQTDLFQTKDLLKDIERDQKWLKRILTIGLISLGLLSLLVALLYKSRQKVLKQSQEIEEKNSSLQSYSDTNALLLSEVHHRVKNNLQNIIALIDLKQDRYKSTEDKMLMDDLSSKIYSMSLMHEQLYREGEFVNIDIKEYITTLIQKFEHINKDSSDPRFELKLEDIKLNLETTMPLGIILTELITNSIKHNPEKEVLYIEIKLTLANELCTLFYSDNGTGILDNSSKSMGTGLSLVQGLVKQLRGTIKIQSDDRFKAEITFIEKQVSRI